MFRTARKIPVLFLLSLMLLGGIADGADPNTEPAQTDSAEKQTFLLRYRFTPGEFVHYHVQDQATVTTRQDVVKESVYNESQIWRDYRVVSVNENGQASLELMIHRVRMEARFGDSQPTIFDSADPALQPDKFREILNTVGKPMNRILVDTRGEMHQLQNLLAGQNQESDPSVNFLVVFPEEAINIGSGWTQSLEVEVLVTKRLKQKVKLLRQYTLTEVKDEVAIIDLKTIISTPVRDPAVRTRLIQQAPHGTIHFDLASQQLVFRDLKVDEQVIGVYGPGSMVETKSLRVEKLLTQTDDAGDSKLSATH